MITLLIFIILSIKDNVEYTTKRILRRVFLIIDLFIVLFILILLLLSKCAL